MLRKHFSHLSRMSEQVKKMAVSEKKRTDYLKWEDYFMSLASISAMRSKDPNTQVRFFRTPNQLCSVMVYVFQNV